jgi:hypothetical protein
VVKKSDTDHEETQERKESAGSVRPRAFCFFLTALRAVLNFNTPREPEARDLARPHSLYFSSFGFS